MPYKYESDYLEHGVKWKNHKYIAIVNGRYIYPEDKKQSNQNRKDYVESLRINNQNEKISNRINSSKEKISDLKTKVDKLESKQRLNDAKLSTVKTGADNYQQKKDVEEAALNAKKEQIKNANNNPAASDNAIKAAAHMYAKAGNIYADDQEMYDTLKEHSDYMKEQYAKTKDPHFLDAAAYDDAILKESGKNSKVSEGELAKNLKDEIANSEPYKLSSQNVANLIGMSLEEKINSGASTEDIYESEMAEIANSYREELIEYLDQLSDENKTEFKFGPTNIDRETMISVLFNAEDGSLGQYRDVLRDLNTFKNGDINDLSEFEKERFREIDEKVRKRKNRIEHSFEEVKMPYKYESDRLSHGIRWKDHKYIRIENGRYIYPEDLVKKAGNAAKSVGGAVKTAGQNAYTYAKSKAPAVKSAVGNAYTTAKDKGTQALDTYKDKGTQALNTAKEKGAQVYNNVKDDVTEKYNDSKIKSMSDSKKNREKKIQNAKYTAVWLKERYRVEKDPQILENLHNIEDLISDLESENEVVNEAKNIVNNAKEKLKDNPVSRAVNSVKEDKEKMSKYGEAANYNARSSAQSRKNADRSWDAAVNSKSWEQTAENLRNKKTNSENADMYNQNVRTLYEAKNRVKENMAEKAVRSALPKASQAYDNAKSSIENKISDIKSSAKTKKTTSEQLKQMEKDSAWLKERYNKEKDPTLLENAYILDEAIRRAKLSK